MDLQALHKISYGLYVITSRMDGRYNGQIVNTLFQVTSEPPRLAASVNRSNLTWEFIKKSRVFAASMLCESTPLTFIGRFGFKSGRETDKLAGLNYKVGETGAPVVLDNTVAYVEVKVTQEVEVGTHTLFIGEVVAAEVLTNEPCLTYEHYHEVKRGKTPKAAATYIAEKKSEGS